MKKFLSNIFTSLLPQGLNILMDLIIPSLIITHYGSEINGIVTTGKTIVTYISLVGAGIATATTQALYLPMANNDVRTVKGMLHSTNNVFTKCGFYYCIVSLVVAAVYPTLINSNRSYAFISCLLFVIFMYGASEFFAVGSCRSLLYSDQRVYICNVVQAISILFGIVLSFVLINIGTSVIVVQLAITLSYVCRAFLLLWYVKKKYPQYSDFKKMPPNYLAVQKRNDAMVHQFAGIASVGCPTLILSSMVGLEAASIFSVYNVVFTGLQTICANLSTALTPYLGKSIALDYAETTKKAYGMLEMVFFAVVAIVYSVTALVIIPFVKLYTLNADINYEYPVFAIIFTLASAFYILKLPGSSLINAAGHFKETKWRAVIEAAISITVGLLCTKLWGICGVVIGMLCALGWRCIDTIYYSNKHILGVSNIKSFVRLVLSLLLIGGSCVVSRILEVKIVSWGSWIYWSLIFTICISIITTIFVFVFDKTTLKESKNFIKILLKNK
ncbi:MAG: polysaccharide biosynthesis C-terminal domain-containing protein [Clostridiales bacterium]|nr:polysaccharide biosynthesis C-terminal domain-containing protein [Candidatus Equinaster intestinalis]